MLCILKESLLISVSTLDLLGVSRFYLERDDLRGTVLIFYSTQRICGFRCWASWYSTVTTRANLYCQGGHTAGCQKIPSLNGWTEPTSLSLPFWHTDTAALCIFLKREMLLVAHSVPWLLRGVSFFPTWCDVWAPFCSFHPCIGDSPDQSSANSKDTGISVVLSNWVISPLYK